MTNVSDVKAPPSEAIAWENDDGAPGRPKRDKVTNWLVPPIIVPAFLIALVIARAVYLAYS